MPINYAEQYEPILVQKYEAELKSNALYESNPGIGWLNAKTIKLPHLTMSGYKDHARTNLFNNGTLEDDWEAKTLEHDRDVQFFIDVMDVEETGLALQVANVTSTFVTEHEIPERDCYTFSKLYQDYTGEFGQTANTDTLTAENILEAYDTFMAEMDDAGVPMEGRKLYVTPATNKLLKEAKDLTRVIHVASDEARVRRYIHELDDVEVISVPSPRMKTLYDFTDGAVADGSAQQINMLLIHPNSVVARKRHDYIRVFEPGSDSFVGDGYLYQNRAYWGAFLLGQRLDGVKFNVS